METLHDGFITGFTNHQTVWDIGWEEMGWASCSIDLDCSIDPEICVFLLKIPISNISKSFLGLLG
jgi:hypothetical protein